MAVKKVNLKSQLVLGIREIGDYSKVKPLLTRLFLYVNSRGIETAGHPIFLCHEESAEKLKDSEGRVKADIEVCVPVKEEVEPDSEGMELGVAFYKLKGGKFAKIIHKGPYEKCEKAYDEIFQWIIDNGYGVSGPVREVYTNDQEVVEPEELITEVYVPIEEGKEDKNLEKEVIKSRSKDYTKSFIHER